MIENGTRRGFLTSIGALILAPAIVRPTSIMPVKLVDFYNTRYLVAYEIGSDRLVLRIDRALHDLIIPKGVHTVSNIKEVYKIIPKNIILSMQPKENQQLHITTHLTSKQLHELGLII